MLYRLLFIAVCVAPFLADAQIKGKAISYTVEIDLEIFDPNYADQSEAENTLCLFEVDAYYADNMVKTFPRAIRVPEDYDLLIAQRYYAIPSHDEYQIITKDQYMLHKTNQYVTPRKTGESKDILGYKCKEYVFADHRGVIFNVWVTDKLQKNVCPAGNFGLKGTALELFASNGIHYLATDFAEGELSSGFFDLPQGFRTETMDLAVKK
jgi:hypothetical protein